jgi:ADP-ribosylglycohydrolase
MRSLWLQPYNSYGNGSAMCVSSAGWLFNDLAKVRQMVRLSADVTHNHPEVKQERTDDLATIL